MSTTGTIGHITNGAPISEVVVQVEDASELEAGQKVELTVVSDDAEGDEEPAAEESAEESSEEATEETSEEAGAEESTEEKPSEEV